MAKIVLDPETFKALASPTRLAVLKSLDARRKTVTELGADLDLNKATVHEHIQILVATGLVKKMDEGRKWIYYELTWQGQRLLHPEGTTTFMVLLGLSVAAAGGGFTMLGRALGWWLQGMERSLQDDAGESDAAGAPEAAQTRDAQDPPAEDAVQDGGFFDDGGWIALALLASAILFSVLAAALRRRRRRAEPA